MDGFAVSLLDEQQGLVVGISLQLVHDIPVLLLVFQLSFQDDLGLGLVLPEHALLLLEQDGPVQVDFVDGLDQVSLNPDSLYLVFLQGLGEFQHRVRFESPFLGFLRHNLVIFIEHLFYLFKLSTQNFVILYVFVAEELN